MPNSVLVDPSTKLTPKIAIAQASRTQDRALEGSTLEDQTLEDQTLDITVAVPTYNGAKRLPLVLDKLKSQINTDRLNWEIIICDNNSTDDTAAVVRQYQTSWPNHIPLHYRFEPQQGSAFARQRAVVSARGNLVAFLDDDNIPAEDWVSSAYEFAQNNPKAGAFGSQIHGQFESELPDELENIKCFLAIIERGEAPHRYEPVNKILPPAAGLVVRKLAWLEAVPRRLFLNNKGKAAGLASEDLEAILHIQKSGWEIWYNPHMVVHHDIPDSRLRKDYLVTLFRCVGLSSFHIRMLGLEKWKRPFAVPAYIANDIRKLALHRLRYGRRSPQMTATESCYRERLETTIASPFFLLKKAVVDRVQEHQDHRFPERQTQLEQLTWAFENNQFSLYEQPVVSVAPSTNTDTALLWKSCSTSFTQSEMLLRLHNSSNNQILPKDFFPTAQRYGLMRTLDRWVIRHLFDRVSNLSKQYQFEHSTYRHKYSINLSPDSVKDNSLIDFVSMQLKKNSLPAYLFCFEIDARTALSLHSQTLHLTTGLRHLGAQVTLDNVDIDRHTIHLIEQLAFDYVKLNPMQSSSGSSLNPDWLGLKELVQRSSALAIAKGIESRSILSALQQQGIRYGQGYQLARPKPLK